MLRCLLASHDNEASKFSSALALASGIVLGLFEDGMYKSESKKPYLKYMDIIGFGTGSKIEKKLKYAEDVSYGVIFGRELINSHANVLTLAVLVEKAANVGSWNVGDGGLMQLEMLWMREILLNVWVQGSCDVCVA